MGLFRTVGYGGDSGSISDIEKAGLVVIIGSNTAESHPVLATRVKRAHKMHGQKLIVADLRNENAAAGYQIPKANLSAFWTPLVAKCRTAGGPVVASLKKSRYGLCQHPLTVPVQGDDAALAIETT